MVTLNNIISRSEISKMSLCLVLSHIIAICESKADGSFSLHKDFSHAAFPGPSLYITSVCAYWQKQHRYEAPPPESVWPNGKKYGKNVYLTGFFGVYNLIFVRNHTNKQTFLSQSFFIAVSWSDTFYSIRKTINLLIFANMLILLCTYINI